jgi:uracil-DNA glycosylase family 4
MSTLQTLNWLVEAGADEAMGDAPINRLSQPPPQGERSKFAAQISGRGVSPGNSTKSPSDFPTLPLPGEKTDSISSAMEIAAACNSLAELKTALEAFDGGALKRGAAHTVFADGTPSHGIMLIGEAPGREEDQKGLPFVGRAGQLLDRMLAAIALDRRSNAYITNVINWRPPGNRDPSPEEAAMCLPFLRRHIELAAPRIIILLGAVAARHVMGHAEGIMKIRGRWMEYRVGERMVPIMPTLHPAYLLRQPAHKKLAWRDLQAIAEKMESLGLLEPATRSN